MTRVSLAIAGVATGSLLVTSGSFAYPDYLEAFEQRYPTTTITSRIEVQAGAKCYTCHHPEQFSAESNCYRVDLKKKLNAGMTIQEAIAAVEWLDSDGDGVPNLVEILRPRVDEPGEIGYVPGLYGPDGKDKCIGPPYNATAISLQNETPCLADADLNGVLDIDDFIAFQTTFALGLDEADVNFDGVLDIDDFIAYQTLFAIGCEAF